MDETGAVCGMEFLNANEQLVEGDDGKLVLIHALSGGRAEFAVASKPRPGIINRVPSPI